MTTFNFEVPELVKRFVSVKVISQGFPTASRVSPRAKKAAVDDLVSKGMDVRLAEKSVNARESLFPDGELRELRNPYDAFNYWLGANTISWIGHGSKVCSVHRIEAIERRFAEMQLIVLQRWSKFMANYDRIIADLKTASGAAWDGDLYPSKASLEHGFKLELVFEPLANPDAYTDYLGGLSPTQAETLKRQLSEQVEKAAKDATADYAKDLHDLLSKMSTQLAGGKVDGKYVRFNGNHVSRLRDMVQSRLNLTGDSQLDTALNAATLAVDAAEKAAKVRDNRKKNKFDQYLQDDAARQCKAAADKLAGLL